MKLIHVIEKVFNSGAASSLKQIYDALSCSSVIDSQDVICVKNKKVDKQLPDFFPVPASYSTFDAMINQAKNGGYHECVFVFHKLMCSPTKMFSNLLWKMKQPYFVINHTYSDSVSFNRLFNFTECVCVSDHMTKKMSSNNKNTNFYTIKNIVDYNFVSQFKCLETCDNNTFKTGRINAINSIKYSPDFIKWICGIKLSKPHVHEYIGTGQHYNEAYNLAESCKNESSYCSMIGAINDDHIKFSKLKSWDIFLYHINRPEGTSMAVLESLASGVPVICSNMPGNNELILNGVNGYVFDSFGEAESILRTLSDNQDKLDSLKFNTKSWALENLNKKYFQKEYENVISAVVNNFNYKSLRKPSATKSVRLFGEERNASVRESIKKVVKDRMPNRKESKIRKIYPKDTYRNKHIAGRKVLNKNVLLTHSQSFSKEQRTYFPIFCINHIQNIDLIYSDMIGFSQHEFNENSIFIPNAKEYANCQYIVLHTKNYLIEKLNDLESLNLEKSDIIYVNNNNINNFKNLIISKSIWAEKEK